MMKQRHYRPGRIWIELKEQGRTVRWLARVTGFHETYISSMRTGNRPITEQFARQAAVALGRPMDDLFVPEEFPP